VSAPALPCPRCHAAASLHVWLAAIDLCWPYRRFVRTRCALCKAGVMLIPGFETLTIGTVDVAKDPVLVPAGRVEPDDYDVHWSSSGVRVTLDGTRYTARAAEADRVE
jgi:hypothetical protein